MRIMISGESGINRTGLRDGLLTGEDWNGINRSGVFTELCLTYIFFLRGFTPAF